MLITYTIAYAGDEFILACVPDSEDVAAVVRERCAAANIEVPAYAVQSGLILSGERRAGTRIGTAAGRRTDASDLFWVSCGYGRLTDAAGRIFPYAYTA